MRNTRPIGSVSLIGLDEFLAGGIFMKNLRTNEAACGDTRGGVLLV